VSISMAPRSSRTLWWLAPTFVVGLSFVSMVALSGPASAPARRKSPNRGASTAVVRRDRRSALRWARRPARPSSRRGRAVPSPIVFPRPTIRLRFNHALHVGTMHLACTRCHKEKAGRMTVSMASCTTCHAEAVIPKGFGRAGHRSHKTCSKCHQSYYANGFPRPTLYPKSHIRFPHHLHVTQSGASCTTCHGGVAGQTRLGGRHVPKMATCVSCHRRRRVASECTTCHERRDSRHLRVHFSRGTLKPGASLGLLEHGPTFRRHHGAAARSRQRTCQSCHEQSTCLKCHAGQRKVLSIHPGNYVLRHGSDARAHPGRCQACHTKQRFCLDCHRRMHVTSDHPADRFRRRAHFHPPNWASAASRSLAHNRHAIHARRNLGSCVSCHRQSTCIRCHASRGVGGYGWNPHGPGFAHSRRCRMLVKRNRRTCLKCHRRFDPHLQCR